MNTLIRPLPKETVSYTRLYYSFISLNDDLNVRAQAGPKIIFSPPTCFIIGFALPPIFWQPSHSDLSPKRSWPRSSGSGSRKWMRWSGIVLKPPSPRILVLTKTSYGHRSSGWMPVGTEFLSDGNTHQNPRNCHFPWGTVYTVHRHISRSGLHHDQAFNATTPAARVFAATASIWNHSLFLRL